MKTILITGASEGIGRASALAFAARGDRVAAVARNRERLESLVAELGGAPQAHPFVGDVTDADSMRRCVEAVLELWGVPDVVVANAGRGLDALFTETTDEALRSVFDINVFGLVRTIRPFVQGMIDRGSGRILLISSIVGKRGIPHYAAYSASKFALHGMAESLRTELHGTGVSVGLICPASTTTAFHDNLLQAGPKQRRVRPRTHSPESVARAIVRMAGSNRREIVLGLEAKLLVLGNTLVPGLVDRILARALTRRTDR